MTEAQKVIKIIAMAFAIFLCVTIIGGILAGITGIMYLFSDKDKTPGDMELYPISGEISSLSVDLGAADLQIQIGQAFSVESDHEYVCVEVKDGKLSIRETKRVFSFSSKGITVVLTVPEGFVFDEADIDTGAGKVRVDALSTDILELSLGAGEAKIQNLTVNFHADIEGGAGVLSIDGGKINNMKLDMGVGELRLKCRITGESKLDMGVGEAKLTLLGTQEDYRISLDKGIGQANLSGESMRDGGVYGTGENSIDIDGGVGSIRIVFSQNG